MLHRLSGLVNFEEEDRGHLYLVQRIQVQECLVRWLHTFECVLFHPVVLKTREMREEIEIKITRKEERSRKQNETDRAWTGHGQGMDRA